MAEADVVRDAVLAHLSAHLGQPRERFDLPGPPFPGSAVESLSILRFETRLGTVMATAGASAYRMPDRRRMELVMVLRPDAPAGEVLTTSRALSLLAVLSEREGADLPPGSIVECGTTLRDVGGLDALMLIPATGFPRGFERPSLGRDSVDLIQVVPIHGAEAQLAIRRGPKRLLDRIGAERLDVRRLDRPCTIAAKRRQATKPSRGRRAIRVS